MMNETNDIFPDYEIRICESGREVALLGMFLHLGGGMDVGMGIAQHISREALAGILKLAAAALQAETSWYDHDGLVSNPEVAAEIKRGEIS